MRRFACNAAILAMLSVCVGVSDGRPQPIHLDARSTLGDLLRHPAFAGFVGLMLPWDDRDYDARMPLTRVGSLLPYHTQVDSKTITGALNRMIDDAADGKTLFYRYPNLGHGFGLGVGTSAEGWIADAIRFWQALIPRPQTSG